MPHPLVRRALSALAVALCVAAPTVARAQYAIIVNPANGVDNLTLDQLKRVFLGQSATLPNGKPAELAFFTPERATFSKSVLGLPDAAVKQRWIGIVFRGESTSQPQDLAQPEQVRKFVAEHPNGVAFVRVADADASVKVLRIDGKKPADAGYAVR
jgi:ABC-type phosphate transport system substrate-binding protein